jgi:hypothetical protein
MHQSMLPPLCDAGQQCVHLGAADAPNIWDGGRQHVHTEMAPCGKADHVHVLSQNAGQRPAYPGVMKNVENSGTSPRIIVSGFPTEQAGGRENGGKVPTADRCQLRSAPAEQ